MFFSLITSLLVQDPSQLQQEWRTKMFGKQVFFLYFTFYHKVQNLIRYTFWLNIKQSCYCDCKNARVDVLCWRICLSITLLKSLGNETVTEIGPSALDRQWWRCSSCTCRDPRQETSSRSNNPLSSCQDQENDIKLWVMLVYWLSH